MFEEQPQQSDSVIHTVRIAMAFILLALAVPVGIWVLTLVSASINDTNTPAIVAKILPDPNTPADINTPFGRFELPKPLFGMMSYFILYLFLLIPMTITIALLKGSVSLLSPDMTRQFRRLVDTLSKSPPPKQ